MASPSLPWAFEVRSNTLFILATVAIGMFTDLFLYGLIVPILPFILSDRLGVEASEIQYYTSVLLASYAGASVVFSFPAGYIADRLPSRQLPFLIGLVALLASTVLLMMGRSIEVLVAARVFQGVSGAVVWTIGLALVMDTVGSEKLGVTIGSIFSFISVGELVAPVLGGVVYDKVGSNAVFGMGLGLLGLDFVMRVVMIEKKTARKYCVEDGDVDNDGERTDGRGANGEEGMGENAPLLGNGNGKDQDLESWRIQKELPAWVQKFPILFLLSSPRLLTAELVAFMQATIIGVFDATIPTQSQSIFGFPALKAGLLFMPLVLPYLILGPVAGMGVDRYGPKIIGTAGYTFFIIPLILLRLPAENTTHDLVTFCVLLSLCGVGLALIGAPSIVEASYVAEKYYRANKNLFGEGGPYAQLYALNSMVFSAGFTLGPLIAGSLKESIGYGNMNAVVAGMCAVVALLCFGYLGGTPHIRGGK
ncbi:putative MFS amine transporter [Sclerotinia borealis F-4128]|uniref:Putative MFS amine transporter n=1 Tax=Sclerotinia borealis (strain F-4128) TaxID=1432307 RepID=W9C5V5_SCLBF|nr:putative MFS amine transporter [Sclerotinia borealis F-4128]